MFKKILLPVDLTTRHEKVLKLAEEMAGQSGGEVILLHVIETIDGVSLEEDRPFYNRLERTARGHLDRWGKQLGEHKIPWRAEVRYGNRAQESAGYAKDEGTDLIIVTAPRLDPKHPGSSLTSASYKIGILAECPVLLVK